MKALSIVLGLAAASGVSYGIWQHLARKDDQKKYAAALLALQAKPPSDAEGVFTPPGYDTSRSQDVIDGAYGVNLMGAYGVMVV